LKNQTILWTTPIQLDDFMTMINSRTVSFRDSNRTDGDFVYAQTITFTPRFLTLKIRLWYRQNHNAFHSRNFTDLNFEESNNFINNIHSVGWFYDNDWYSNSVFCTLFDEWTGVASDFWPWNLLRTPQKGFLLMIYWW